MSVADLGLTIGVLFFCAGLYFYVKYPGFIQFLGNQMRYATWKENENLLFMNLYWLDFMEKLRLDASTGVYGFDEAAKQENDDFKLGKIEYHRGNFLHAISLIEQSIRKRGETEASLFWLAMCYMREAEAQNCLRKLLHASDSQNDLPQLDHCSPQGSLCCLPLTRYHDHPHSSQKAAQLFQRLLENHDDKNRLYQWLLNFCYMTINGFPEQVPAKYRIKSSFMDAFYGEQAKLTAEEFKHLHFQDCARSMGIDMYGTGRGVAVEDFNNDGYLDIVTGGGFEEVVYYKNDRGVRFVNKTVEAGLAGIKQPFIITAADYDNDGWMDLFISRPFGRFQLLKNNRNGTFIDVTASSGLLDTLNESEIAATWVPAWGDVNNDGYLDLFLAQWGMKLPFVSGLMAKPRMDSKLLINQGGRFVDRTKEYGLTDIVKDEYFIGAAFGDYDADGYPDLFLSSPTRNRSVLLRNVNGQRFEKTDLIQRAEGGFVASFVDVNHDGKLEIFQTGFADATTSVEMAVFGEHLDRYTSGHTTLFMQTEDGRFIERSDLFDMPMGTMGGSYGDLNNSGACDFYLGTGDPEGWFVLPNLMYAGEMDGSRCAERWKNISMLQGFGSIQKGHGIVFCDFNNDGRQDIYSSLGGMWPADRWTSQLLINQSTLSNAWVKIRLRGRQTNRFGVGCMIKVIAQNAHAEEIVRYYHMDNKTGFGSAPYLAHVGLLDAVLIKTVEVHWPVSRCWKTYQAEIKQLNILDERGDSTVAPEARANIDHNSMTAVVVTGAGLNTAQEQRQGH